MMSKKHKGIVITGDKLVRGDDRYEVLIADENIFVVGCVRYDENEGSDIVSYENTEIYSNQRSMGCLWDYGFKLVGTGCEIEENIMSCEECGFCNLGKDVETNKDLISNGKVIHTRKRTR